MYRSIVIPKAYDKYLDSIKDNLFDHGYLDQDDSDPIIYQKVVCFILRLVAISLDVTGMKFLPEVITVVSNLDDLDCI